MRTVRRLVFWEFSLRRFFLRRLFLRGLFLRRFFLWGLSLGVCADGDENGVFLRASRIQIAVAIETAAGLENEAGRVKIAESDGALVDFHLLGGAQCASEATENQDAVALDLSPDFSCFAEHKGVAREDLALEGAVEAKRAGGLKRALYARVAVKEAGPIGAVVAAREEFEG